VNGAFKHTYAFELEGAVHTNVVKCIACSKDDEPDNNDIALYLWWGIAGAGGLTASSLLARDQLQEALVAGKLTHEQRDFLATIDLTLDMKFSPVPLSNWWYHLPRTRPAVTSA
jgi:hypothetical protein